MSEPEDPRRGDEPADGSRPGRVTAPGTRAWLIALSIVAVAVQFWGLYSPGSAVPSVPIVGVDKAVHALLFGVPVWLIGRLTGRYARVAVIFWIHAALSEFIQYRYIPTRDGDVYDLVADTVGILVAVWLLTTPVRNAGTGRE